MDLRRPITEHRARTVAAPASVVWDVVAAIGGPGGWGTFEPAWRLRGRVDEALGGPGMRGRPRRLKVGAASRTSSVNPVPGPTASCVALTRVALTVITPPPLESTKLRLVLPARVVLMSETVWPSKPSASIAR